MEIEHRYLRSALEYAVQITHEAQKLKPPLRYPAALKPFLKMQRLPATALGPVRRAIEADEQFRVRLAAGALPDLVDDIGLLWLQRPPGWHDTITRLVVERDAARDERSTSEALRRAERRREAAEVAAVRTRAELVTAAARISELDAELAAAKSELATAAATVESLRAELADARRTARHAADREAAMARRIDDAEQRRSDAEGRAAVAERQRDDALAERAGLGVAGGANVADLRIAAERARGLAELLADVVGRGAPIARTPLGLPGGIRSDSRAAAEHLLRVDGAVVLVDGYNVAKLAFPELDLELQRERALDLVDDVVRRWSARITVVFDGADIEGAAATKRRLSRVVFSPGGVLADDVLRAEVAALPPSTKVVVVTSDEAVRRDVRAAGANTVSSRAFLDAARR
jgi:predicted RNA-binding protein with PIN domain